MSLLTVDVHVIRKEVAWLFLGTREYASLTEDEQAEIDDMIEAGYRQFLTPIPIDGERRVHRWNFLSPVLSLTTTASEWEYMLPEDFGGLVGGLTYNQGTDARWHVIETTGAVRIRKLRALDSTTNSAAPQLAAIEPFTSSGVTDQRWKLMLWPTPDKAYDLQCRYHKLPQKLTDTRPIPVGGPEHGETILESCLAIAEQRLTSEPGLHTQKFAERLRASIHADRQMHAPQTLGVNADRGDPQSMTEQEYRRYYGNLTTYDGSVYYDVNP